MIGLKELQIFLIQQENESTIQEVLEYFELEGKKSNVFYIESLRKYDSNIKKNYKIIDGKCVSSYFYERDKGISGYPEVKKKSI